MAVGVHVDEVERPGLHVNEASPCIKEGSFWAWLHPLALLKAKFDAGEGGSACFDSWSPFGGDNEYLVLMPLKSDTARLLWYDQLWPEPDTAASAVLGKQGHPYKTGDVVLAPDGRLWFVGPDTKDKQIHVLADWVVDETSIIMGHVYQKGPPKPAEQTRLERIANAK